MKGELTMNTKALFAKKPITLALVMLFQSPWSQAQTATTIDDEPTLASVVVTAQKREEKLQDVPLAISVLGGDNLGKTESFKTANDITQLIPNASASATDGRTRPRWFLRGIGTNETAANTVSPIGVYNDDVYLNNVYIQGFPLFDIDRVEVLRGPQGTLWGKNTTGGAIHYQSRQPKFTPDGYAKIGLGSFNERTLQGAVGGSLVEDKLAARISFYDESRDGWVNNTVTNQKAGGVKDTAFRAQLLWLANNDTEVLTTIKSRKLNGDKSPSFYVRNSQRDTNGNIIGVRNSNYAAALRGNDSIAQAGVFDEKLDSDGASVRINWSQNGYTLTSITAYDTGSRILNTGSPIALDISRSRLTSDSAQTTQELRLASPKDKKYDWVIGAYYFKESLNASSATRRDATAGANAANNIGNSRTGFELFNFNQDTLSTAFFGSGTFRFDEFWSLSSGVRTSKESKDFNLQFSNTANPTYTNLTQWWLPSGASNTAAFTPFVASNTWEEVTYDVTPQWKINPNANAYLRYSKGYRAGGFVNGPLVNGSRIKRIDPETLYATELGVKSQWLDGRLIFNSALFNYDYQNIIVGVLIPGVTGQVQENAAQGTSKGAEFELSWQPNSKWRLAANLGLLKTEYSSYQSTAGGSTINATGNRFTRAPEITFGLDGEYRIPLASGGSLSLGGDISWRDKQYFNAVDQTDPALEQSAYALANTRVSYRSGNGKFELTGYVRNLTDTLYSQLATTVTDGSGDAGQTGITRQVYGLPRTLGVTALLRF